jgi:hypothetical protein
VGPREHLSASQLPCVRALCQWTGGWPTVPVHTVTAALAAGALAIFRRGGPLTSQVRRVSGGRRVAETHNRNLAGPLLFFLSSHAQPATWAGPSTQCAPLPLGEFHRSSHPMRSTSPADFHSTPPTSARLRPRIPLRGRRPSPGACHIAASGSVPTPLLRVFIAIPSPLSTVFEVPSHR